MAISEMNMSNLRAQVMREANLRGSTPTRYANHIKIDSGQHLFFIQIRWYVYMPPSLNFNMKMFDDFTLRISCEEYYDEDIWELIYGAEIGFDRAEKD